jgi:hypothetical protein
MPSNLPESPITSNETEKLTESSVLDSLSTELEEEDNETETEETPSKQDDSSDSEDEEDSDESEEAEVKIESKDEDLEDLRYTNVPTRDTLKKAYPDIFKKYPELDRAIYREKAYTEIFPSIK